MRWALAVLTVAAFLTFAFEATAGPAPLPAIAVGAVYTLVATLGYRWVDGRGRGLAAAYLAFALLLGYATFGMVPRTGATLLVIVLVGQAVHLLGLRVAVALVVLLPFMHVGMALGEGLRAAAGTLVAGAFVAATVVLYEREQQARAALAEANEQLRAFAAQAQELATTRERNRVARDIHDGLGHHLTVVAMQVQAARAVLPTDPAKADAVLEKAQTQAREALADVRRSVAALREPRTAPLAESLGALAEAAGMPVELQVHGAARSLPEAATEALLRASQEGLTNVCKHAGAGRVTLDLTYGADSVTVEVRDDGRGGAAETAGRFGLVGLRERAAALGGAVALRSAPGEGTTLRMEVPG